MRTDNKIHVVEASLTETEKEYGLTKLQLFICKLFRITPICKYRQAFILVLPLPYKEYGGAINDVLHFTNDEDWLVVSETGRAISVVNMKARNTEFTEKQFRGMEGVVIGSAYKETKVR